MRTALFVLLCLCACGASSVAEALTLRRGVAVHNMLNWAETTVPFDGTPVEGAYVFPPFTAAPYRLAPELIDAIGAAGFDFVRLTVDPGPFLYFTGKQRDALDAILLDRVRLFQARGLSVVVDFHPNEQRAGYTPDDLVASERGELFDAYKAMLARTAELLGPLGSVAMEPMNEPQLGYSGNEPARWMRMQASMAAAIRAQAPSMPLVLTGDRGGSTDGLFELDPTPFVADPNVYFSFHYYLPYEFTHQGIDFGRPVWAYFVDVPYPPRRQKLASAKELADARIEAEAPAGKKADLATRMRSIFDRYARTAGPETTAKHFDRVAAWARSHAIPPERIILGEFGAVRTEGKRSPPDRLNWLAEVRQAAESRGFAWSVWVLTEGFGIDDPATPTRLEKRTLRSLGL